MAAIAPEHLTDIIKMVAYQAERDLVTLLRPHYARAPVRIIVAAPAGGGLDTISRLIGRPGAMFGAEPANSHGRSTSAMISGNCVSERDRGQGITSAFGTPIHRGCNDSVVAVLGSPHNPKFLWVDDA